MRKLIAIGCFLYAGSVFADCETLLTEAHKVLKKANQYSAYSSQHLKKMQDMIETDSTNEDICTTAQDTRMGAFQAAKAYRVSRENFLLAVDDCPAPYDAEAAENADVMTTFYNNNATLVAAYDKLIVKNCSGNALTPLL